jgi:hypothetical protein
VLEINATQRYYFQRGSFADPHGYGQLSRFLSPAVQALLTHEQVGTSDDAEEPPVVGTPVAGVDQLINTLLV